MQLKDLLDRFELLYSDNEILSDLRRSYTDKDLSSIFRLIKNEDLRKAVVEKNLHSIFRLLENSDGVFNLEDFRKAVIERNLHSIFRLVNNEDLRKAVIEENLHSIFRLTSNEDLRKLILEDNYFSCWKILSKEVDTSFISAFKYFYNEKIDINYDCFSRGQISSKIWLVNELKKLDLDLGTVFLCAGWYATLAVMMFENNLKIKKIRSFDIDPSCELIADRFNKFWILDEWKFKSVTANILDLNYDNTIYHVTKNNGKVQKMKDTPDTIINTSCEHIENFSKWYDSIPDGKLVILQTNDYFAIEDHVNCSNSLIDFADKTPMRDCLYEGELELPKYRRFLRIGYK